MQPGGLIPLRRGDEMGLRRLAQMTEPVEAIGEQRRDGLAGRSARLEQPVQGLEGDVILSGRMRGLRQNEIRHEKTCLKML